MPVGPTSSEHRGPDAAGPLSSIRVVELAGIGPAQFGGMLLADMGADVIRVDRPAPEDEPDPGEELLWRGRRAIELDLKHTGDHRLAVELITRADVLIDPYRPGVTERLGLGPSEMLDCNPRLVYARMTGWGQEGPLARTAGHDINFIALAGALEPLGEAGQPPPVPLNLIGDFGGGGMLLAVGVLAALYERSVSGRGQVVDVSMLDGIAALMSGILQLRGMGLWDRERGSNWLQGAAPWYRAYATSDGRYVTVGALEPKFYRELLDRLGLVPEQWPQYDRGCWPALGRRMGKLFGARTLAEWRAELEGTDVCFAPVLTLDELAEHPHLSERATYITRHGALQPGVAPRFSRTPSALGGPPPSRGEQSAEIVAELSARGLPPLSHPSS
jgi:alpha-methylacyl-CoA racemase